MFTVLRNLAPFVLIVLSISLLMLTGCERGTRHQILTTLFDGVPSLPPVEELCQDYAQDPAPTEISETPAATAVAVDTSSSHRPYADKHCEGCHDFNTSAQLIRPPMELCFVCHKDFIQGAFVHGPVSVGDCLACHLPHQSTFSSLLQTGKNQICSKCHHEGRLAAAMHERVMVHNLNCVDCHDPHFGNAQYFLK